VCHTCAAFRVSGGKHGSENWSDYPPRTRDVDGPHLRRPRSGDWQTQVHRESYRFIHFATHSVFDDEHPESSGVVLSLFDQNGSPEDGYLRLKDIYNLKLSADLVVLSPCNTALGRDIKGEGIEGITRGFMYAGASRVAATLWSVDDEATSEFMKWFYIGILQKHLSPSASLREAQMEIRKLRRWNSRTTGGIYGRRRLALNEPGWQP
jgi:CHAT domain-containing protein